MKEINESTIIASLLIQIDKDILTIEELLEYSNEIYNKLKDNKYNIKMVKEFDILKFFKYYAFVGRIKNNIIYLNNNSNIKAKIERHFLKDLSQELKLLLYKSEKFILPIIYDNKLIKYYLTIDHFDFINELKNKFLYDKENNRYIIDFDLVINILGNEYIDSFFNNNINNSRFEKKEVLDCNTILEFIDKVNFLSQSKFSKLNVDDEILSLKNKGDILSNYYSVATNNQKILFSKNMVI